MGWRFGSLEGVVGFQFWDVYFEKIMRGRSLRLGYFGRKEEEGELFPHSSRSCLSHFLFKDSDFRRTRGKCLDYLIYLSSSVMPRENSPKQTGKPFWLNKKRNKLFSEYPLFLNFVKADLCPSRNVLLHRM